MNALIADTTVPYAVTLAGSFQSAGMPVAILAPVGTGHPALPAFDGLSLVHWNRASRLSARTVHVAVKNAFSSLDCAVIVFDARAFSSADKGFGRDDAPSVIEKLVGGTLLLVGELEALFLNQGHGKLVFAHIASDPDGSSEASARGNIAVAVAESAFIRFAEEMAAGSSSKPGLQVSLVRIDGAEDSETASWFAQFLAAPAAQRGSARWIKAGSRGLFGKF